MMQSWLASYHFPVSTTANTSPLVVQSLHFERMSAGSSGLNFTMRALIFRPLIPPASLISLT